jgi:hypothetical protein
MKRSPPAAGVRGALVQDHVAPSVGRQRSRRGETGRARADDVDNRAFHDRTAWLPGQRRIRRIGEK